MLDNQSKLIITSLSEKMERKIRGNESFMPKGPSCDERHGTVQGNCVLELVS